MTIDFSSTANHFNQIQVSSDHLYLVIERDANNGITGCKTTNNRNERSSLKDINELATACLRQYNHQNKDINGYKNICNIKNGIENIQEKILDKDRGCISLIWFLYFSREILGRTSSLIRQMARIFPPINTTEEDQGIKHLYNARKRLDEGKFSDALAYYKLSAKEGNLSAYSILIEKYKTRLGQDALRIHLKASSKYLELGDQTNFRNAVNAAFNVNPKLTLLYMIKFCQQDIKTLFTNEQIQNVNFNPDLAKAYLANAETFLKIQNLEKAREQCQLASTYDSEKANEMLKNIEDASNNKS